MADHIDVTGNPYLLTGARKSSKLRQLESDHAHAVLNLKDHRAKEQHKFKMETSDVYAATYRANELKKAKELARAKEESVRAKEVAARAKAKATARYEHELEMAEIKRDQSWHDEQDEAAAHQHFSRQQRGKRDNVRKPRTDDTVRHHSHDNLTRKLVKEEIRKQRASQHRHQYV